ncbi:hypothetical protein MNBD_GAMMA26-2646 [hydrothermal vent metagenome]|uniref:HicB family protein n=1 Tax=hydrothermal vent metagenome TaxID=652676 RepID=A0A3B1BAN2_9ZZZZ
MMLEIDKYTYRVTWSEEDKEFVGLCAELPSLSWLATMAEKALKGIRSMVQKCVDDMAQNSHAELMLRCLVYAEVDTAISLCPSRQRAWAT